jgi:hypothetical protein
MRFPVTFPAGELEDDEDAQEMETMLAVSPPEWAGEGDLKPVGEPFDEEEYEDDSQDEDEIPDSNFAVLDTSLPGRAEG